MNKLSTIQKRKNLNSVLRIGDPGPGGAYHDYVIEDAEDTNLENGMVKFQRGPRNEHDSRDGVLDADLLEIVRDRLQHFQRGEYATRENACALTHIEEALMWMNKRVEDRIERNVLGTCEK